MSPTSSLALLSGIMFTSAFLRSAIGFGNALVAMPLLALVIGIQSATPLVALSGATLSIAILISSWRAIDFRAAGRLILISLAGIPCGLVLLTLAPESLVMTVLGLLLMLYGLYSLLTPSLPVIRHDGLTYLCGFVAGVLGGAYNTNGPPVVIYGMLRGWPPAYFRATLQCYFLATSVVIVAGHAAAGLWTSEVLQLYVYSLPPIVLGTIIGGWMNAVLPKELFRRILCVCLIGIGALCLAS